MSIFIFKKIGGGRTLKSLLLVLLLGVVGLMNAQNTENRGGAWYYYDDGSCIGSLVNGNNPNNQICCGVMFPSGFYSGDILTKVSIYNRDRDDRLFSGSIIIFNDGETAPQSPVASMNIETTPIGEFVEYTFNQPVQIDPTKNVWVIMDGIGCAPVCANTGNPNGRWDYHSGVWQDLVSLGLEGTFMIRAYIEDSAPSQQTITEIYIDGFTPPVWGEHPDFEVEVPSNAHYHLDMVPVSWWYSDGEDTHLMFEEDDVFDHEDYEYFMSVAMRADEGYEFADDLVVFFNGDASVFYPYFSGGTGYYYSASTILYSVTAPSPSNTITEVHLDGFTAPAWGAHPDYDLTVPEGAPYAISEVEWNKYDGDVTPQSVFDDENDAYYLKVILSPAEGYAFDPDATVYFNGDASICDAEYNLVSPNGDFRIFTIDYQVTAPTPSTYIVTATANPSAGGTVSGGGTFLSGETCTLTATASSGYQFLNWTKNGAEVSANAAFIFTVTENATYTANFIQSQTQTYMLTVSCDPTMGAVTGNGTYAAGTQVTVEAIAYKDYVFDRWNDGVTDNPRTVTLTGNMTLVAFFKGTGVNENGATALGVYPNPAKDVLRIEGLESNATVEIYNSLGMMVRTLTVTADEEINIGDLPQGVYMVRCGQQMLRIVKTK